MTDNIAGLLEQRPEIVKAVLKKAWSGESPVPEDFNWLLLAEGASARAISRSGPEKTINLDWAEVAVDIYESLSRQNKMLSESFEVSAMRIRAMAIQMSGPQKENRLRDPSILEGWFFSSLPFTLEEAQRRASLWRTLTHDEILQLRLIKNRLEPFSLAIDHAEFPREQELRQWLRLRPSLP